MLFLLIVIMLYLLSVVDRFVDWDFQQSITELWSIRFTYHHWYLWSVHGLDYVFRSMLVNAGCKIIELQQYNEKTEQWQKGMVFSILMTYWCSCSRCRSISAIWILSFDVYRPSHHAYPTELVHHFIFAHSPGIPASSRQVPQWKVVWKGSRSYSKELVQCMRCLVSTRRPFFCSGPQFPINVG